MSHVVINAITVPADRSDELAARFAGRAGMVEKADGFERFELLRPADGREQWLVMTTWRDEDAFKAWMSSAAFGAGHGGGGPAPVGHGGGTAAHGAGSGAHGGAAPVSTASEIWAFSVQEHVTAPQG